MERDFFDKLRDEIKDERQLRHDLIIKKFAYLTAFLGVGATDRIAGGTFPIDFTKLLLLVPLIAVAFDLYIFVEDYRIKRAGEFIKQWTKCNVRHLDEHNWEMFIAGKSNIAATFAFVFVTAIYSIASLIIMKKIPFPENLSPLKFIEHIGSPVKISFGVAAVIETLLAINHGRLRLDFGIKKLKNNGGLEKEIHEEPLDENRFEKT